MIVTFWIGEHNQHVVSQFHGMAVRVNKGGNLIEKAYQGRKISKFTCRRRVRNYILAFCILGIYAVEPHHRR